MMTEDIKVTFIIPKDCRSENDCSEDMQLAFTTCEQHSGGGLQARWEHETKWKKFDGLSKRDVFVLTEFEGDLYDKLRATKCLLVGPRCLSCCLTEGAPIPSGPEPVFTVAMRGLIITASGLTKLQKEDVKKKVHWMGGIYNNVLTDDTTHLVSNIVISDKYIKSVEKGIPIMSLTWIEAVWQASLRVNVNGSSAEFNSHKLQPFANLCVTTSGILKKDKQIIMKLVTDNGGVYSGAFQSESTDVVVMNKDGVGSDKYNAAQEYGKFCVLPNWVKDSVKMGVALPMTRYKVSGALTSSPLSITRVPDMSLNFSRITNVRATNNVDETKSSDVTTVSGRMKLSQDLKRATDTSMDREIVTAFESLDMASVKKAGPIFDGFCIWVTGLEGTSKERAQAIVSRCGGVRYETAHERVTHVTCGDVGSAARAQAALPTVPVLSALWLVRSVEAGRALNEAEFIIDTKPGTPAKSTRKPAAESPMSKRNLQLLRRGALNLPPPEHEPANVEPQDALVNHYLSQNVPEDPPERKSPEPTRAAPSQSTRVDPDITEDCDDVTEDIEQVFRGLKIEAQNLEEEALIELGAEIAAAGGILTAAGANGSHVLVPLEFDADEVLTKDAEVVTAFWVRDCLNQHELVPILYYHRPVWLDTLDSDNLPLTGVVACLSTYSGMERIFLDELAKLLGATTQLRFCRRNTADALASTHLICPTPTGDKYAGAVKWGLPAVTASWLLACAEKGARVSERPYLVGDTKAPPSPQKPKTPAKPDNSKVTDNNLREVTNIRSNEENAMLPPATGDVPRRGSMPREGTPKGNGHAAPTDEMSPASRYIAMARQGLLGGDTQETPKRIHELKDDAKQDGDALRTPPLDDALSSPNLAALSPSTRRRLQAVKRGEMPSDPIRTPQDPFENKNPLTPDSGFGAALRPGGGRLSPEARKRLWRVVQDLPGKPADTGHDKHTPLSEIRKRFLAQFNSGEAPTPPSEHHAAPRKLQLQDQADTPPPAKMAKVSEIQHSPGSASRNFNFPEQKKIDSIPSAQVSKSIENDSPKSSNNSSLPSVVDAQLLRLNAVLSNRLSSQRPKKRESISVPVPQPESEPGPESQPNTVGWDDSRPVAQETPSPRFKIFMLSSNVDNREEIIEAIRYLGGEVSDSADFDPEATHLLCAAPGRSEKMLGSIVTGKWVLHPAYVARSRAVGSFLPEEEFEWGNPSATSLPSLVDNDALMARAACRWRQARANKLPGPFHGVTAVLRMPPGRKRLLTKLIETGDGTVLDEESSFTIESITVCFADLRRCPISEEDAAWLRSRAIPVCAPVLISSYLTDDTTPDPSLHCLPEFKPKT